MLQLKVYGVQQNANILIKQKLAEQIRQKASNSAVKCFECGNEELDSALRVRGQSVEILICDECKRRFQQICVSGCCETKRGVKFICKHCMPVE